VIETFPSTRHYRFGTNQYISKRVSSVSILESLIFYFSIYTMSSEIETAKLKL